MHYFEHLVTYYTLLIPWMSAPSSFWARCNVLCPWVLFRENTASLGWRERSISIQVMICRMRLKMMAMHILWELYYIGCKYSIDKGYCDNGSVNWCQRNRASCNVLHWVDQNLEVHENCIGTASADYQFIQDVLLMLNFSLVITRNVMVVWATWNDRVCYEGSI